MTPRNVRTTKGYAHQETRDRPRARRFGQLRAGPRFHEDFLVVKRPAPSAVDTMEMSLYYRVYNPSRLHAAEAPPLVVVHGGPLLPSDYLYPLARQFSASRSLIFYDQLGCGRSSQPEESCMYSIEHAVHDLDDLVRTLQLDKFHLLGHSFGGILAYEYLAAGLHRGADCLSLTLNSTPADFPSSLRECSRLEEEVRSELALDHNMEEEEAARTIQGVLRQRNECRLAKLPDALVSALEGRGTAFGPEDVADYVARPPPRGAPLPPVLVVRGAHDFVADAGWQDIFARDSATGGTAYREETMTDCAHYCHLEDPRAFGDLVGSHCFVHDY